MTTETSDSAAPAGEGLDRHVAAVGTRLAQAFGELLGSLPGAPFRQQQLARRLGVNKDLASRILRATASRDPIAIAWQIPGPEPLRRLVRAARQKGADAARADRAEQAIEQFDHLIRQVAGDRARLDTIISAWLPEVRERNELLSKQAVFKGMSQLKGAAADFEFVSRFVHPAATGGGRDYVLLSGYLGLLRLRPGARVIVDSFHLGAGAGESGTTTLEGNALGRHDDAVLAEFCSAPLPHFSVAECGGRTSMVLDSAQAGLDSRADVVWAQARTLPTLRGVFSTVSIPVRRAICDLFIHRDIEPAVRPEVAVYDTTERGVAAYLDPSREFDRLELAVQVDELGSGVSRFRCAEVPRYIDMLEHVCSKMGWDPDAFTGYRCAIEYPLYGSQLWMTFDPSFGRA